MKTSIKLLAGALLALSVTVSSPALADDDHSQTKVFAFTMFPALDPTKLWLCLEKYQPDEKIRLELVNEKGDCLFTETLPKKASKRNAYRQQFDMSQLGDGIYTFRVYAGSQKEERTFKLATPIVESPTPARVIAIK
ncbi:hypothetical protein [Spirosoma areae]